LKRGLCATIQEWLMAAEYLMAHGTDNIILCERGIRTYETYTRNTLDISAIPVIKALSHLPIIVDPSHATGIREKVAPVALGSIAAGADGLMVEVHPDPDKALSDGPQSLYPEQFEKLMRDIEALSPVIGKELSCLPEDRAYSQMVNLGSSKVAAEGTLVVAFQGERGAYSEKALNQYFHEANGVTPKPCAQFRDVFNAVLHGEAAFGVLPVENALAGSIHENYDLILQYPDIKIVGQIQIRIRHNLIAVPGATLDDIKKVHSHPQGLLQCAAFFDKHPGMEKVTFYDTAGSVAYIAKEGNKALAAIASEEAAAVYKMQILKEGIEDNPHNYTRFVIITREDKAVVSRPNMGSLVFSVQDKPGALLTCLKILQENGINMKKLESRPIHGKPWTYMFYVDVELPDNLDGYKKAYADLEKETVDIRELGLYKV
jgi:prephenate dehydratase